MYNFFKFREDLERAEEDIVEEMRLRQWQQKHDAAEKAMSHEKYVKKVKDFVEEAKEEPFYCEDDHFHDWRKMNQFRHGPNKKKLKGYKAFIYKDNSDMTSIFEPRIRNEMKFHEQKSEMLVNTNKIMPQLKMRSLQSQGPLNSMHSFRDTKDHGLQPPLKFRSITDKQRFIQGHLPQSKFSHLAYDSLNSKRQRIGHTIKRPLNPIPIKQPDVPQRKSPRLNQQKTIRKPVKVEQRARVLQTIDAPTSYTLDMKKTGKYNSVIDMLNKQHFSPLKRYHFKGAKQLSLGVTLSVGQDQDRVAQNASFTLKKCQVDREKDLQNVRNNLNFESYNP